MSWDVFIQHLPASATKVADIPDDFAPLPLGPRAEILDAIAAVFPNADLRDPSWIVVDAPSYSIEINAGSADPVESLALHVRGDDAAIPPIAALIEKLGARALDSWTGEFFDAATATESIKRWRNYLDELES